MTQGSRKLPVQHLTIRVPWHDSGWAGNLCQQCCANSSCIILPRIATSRNDEFETLYAGKSIEHFTLDQRPPCVDEHGTFMSSFPLSMKKTHPYAASAPTTHGHFADTPYTIRPFSVAAVPFRWMLREQVEGSKWVGKGLKQPLLFDYQAEREPVLTENSSWKEDKKTWVQEGNNQRVILDTFFSAAKPEESLVFFYAKRTPMIEDTRRIIIGVGRIKSVSSPVEYHYVEGHKPKDKISGYLWERNIEHSIRPYGGEGFLLPYQQILMIAEKDESIDLASCTAFAPNGYFESYSYATEHLTHDGAIASLLSIEKAVKAMRKHLPDVPWHDYLEWVDAELNRLWEVRGAFPGLGAILNAFGFTHGNLLAWYISNLEDDKFDPWPVLSSVLKKPDMLPTYLSEKIGDTLRKKWEKLPEQRRLLLILLARFNLTDTQALRWYQLTEREKAGITLSDSDILSNPYLIYEDDRLQVDSIAFEIVDRGLFPPESIRKDFPLAGPSLVRENIDERRVRALMILTLEEAAKEEGHTYLMAGWLVQRIRERPLQPECPLDIDTLAIIDGLSPKVVDIKTKDSKEAFQLDRYVETAELIRTKISKRKSAKHNVGDNNWAALVDNIIEEAQDQNNEIRFQSPSARDLKARKEKSAALEVIFRSRVSVLIGTAGTGKSTLLKALCRIESVKNGGILLLAPTGKARVRAEQTTGLKGLGQTAAQFLNKWKRYDGNSGRYYINKAAERSAIHKTIIIDECSMLTEEQLAALLDAIEGVERLVLVGDPRQLPPIGAGRPYMDIIKFLEPETIDSMWPCVAECFAELTVTMRQEPNGENIRDDVQLAQLFSGKPQDPGSDEIWNMMDKTQSEFVKLIQWNKPEQILDLLLQELKTTLHLDSIEDEIKFEESLGGVYSKFNGGETIFFNTEYKDRPGASRKAEDWQILSPIKQLHAGTTAINRAIQQHFRKNFLTMASLAGWSKKITSPAGPEGIIYGDKVINIINRSNRENYPIKDDAYVANGDIGIITGHRKTKNRNWMPYDVEVEFSSQPGVSYKYKPWEFDSQEGTPPLELAYALTIHKTQGSEFGTTFVVLPNPCKNLSREMLYTALTRQKNKLVILHQGDFKELLHYSRESASSINQRMTNLFEPASPVEIKVRNKSLFLDSNLVYLTDNGELVRSKSEWIIAAKLKAAGIKYQYEQPLILDGVERYPDFTIRDEDAGIVWYWEHNGMLNDSEYRARWERKKSAYHNANIYISEQQNSKDCVGILLTTEEGNGTGLDLSSIDANINLILGRT
ncbi:AAA family ATPase [Pectobacterium parmentieri]|uniref:AAA family ATPase n=1 Tax=Pectobacterium parmentieri TaxID=1905730 RepID=UPI0018E1C220|nr:ATP-dependent RecD-like DNA helicase [Pectobacterium parmentieri]QQA74527.1 ATP-dependent RecD-like DNA helicase [Pectobacterium parmentieri]